MATKYHEHVQTKVTPQTEAVPGKPMEQNNAGGFSFVVDDWTRFERFLILGSDKGTYYVGERKLTQDNAAVVVKCLKEDALRAVKLIADISDAGRAPKNDPAIFAYALATMHTPAHLKDQMYAALPKIVRTGTHLFQFAAAVDALRGWGAGLRKAVGRWYTSKDRESLGYQLAKYQQRDGWSHRDVLRLCHVSGKEDPGHRAAIRWAVAGKDALGARTVTRGKGDKAVVKVYEGLFGGDVPQAIRALEALKAAPDEKSAAIQIREFGDKATREMVPTQFLSSPNVWEALLVTMPMTAMLRNLATMTRVGLLAPLADATKTVCERLRDRERLKKARVHPLAILMALKTYQSGKSVKGDSTWVPVQQVCDALDDAFYLAFDAVEPTGKRWMFGLDVSGSMSAQIAGMQMSCCEAATALAMVSARIEPYSFTGRFNLGFQPVPFGKTTRLDEAMKYTNAINGGGTDCSLPMVYAAENKINVDTFCVLTDSETWGGKIHPFQALKQYRDKMGIPAKLIVAGMTSAEFTIADKDDAGMLDVVGFSTDCPALMADFSRS